MALILFTILGALGISFVAKRDRKAGHHRTDDTMRERMSYSKTHQELANASKYNNDD
jgi:hypothetical protein